MICPNPLKSAKLIDLVKEEAVRYGDFTLSTGIKSNYFVEMGKIVNNSNSLNCILQRILFYMEDIDWRCDVVGGPVLGAAPLVGGLLIAYQHHFGSASSLRGFLVRKEEKDGILIEGHLRPGDNVLILEDVVTTGDQTKRAVELVEANGGNVKGIISVLDRLGGAKELLGERFQSMMTIEDLEIKL